MYDALIIFIFVWFMPPLILSLSYQFIDIIEKRSSLRPSLKHRYFHAFAMTSIFIIGPNILRNNKNTIVKTFLDKLSYNVSVILCYRKMVMMVSGDPSQTLLINVDPSNQNFRISIISDELQL